MRWVLGGGRQGRRCLEHAPRLVEAVRCVQSVVRSMLMFTLFRLASSVFGIRRYHKKAAAFLGPLIEERRAAKEGAKRVR